MTTNVRRSATAYIDLNALDHNVSIVKSYAQQSKILAVIKSDAYGHGLLVIANRLKNQVQGFGVACVNEAIALREAGIVLPIIVLQGFISKSELKHCFDYQLTPIVHCYHQLDMLENNEKKIAVWLKFDTGMGRFGFSVEEAENVLTTVISNGFINIDCIVSHLSDADNIASEKNIRQFECFEKIKAFNNSEKSLLNSGGLLNKKLPRYDWVRVGLMLYGVSPINNKTSKQLNLRAVMTLKAPIIAIKTLRSGDTIGYSGATKLTQDTQIAVVSIGYGDGLLRSCKNMNVLINGVKTTIVGNISMDSLVVNLQGISAKEGDIVIIWGDKNPVEQLANKADTISYELLCATKTIKHKYVN